MILAPEVFEVPATAIRKADRVLLVSEAPIFLNLRALLLKSIPATVQCVESCHRLYGDGGRSYALIILALKPDSGETTEVALFCRRQWSTAKILLLAREDHTIDDWLYDERLDPLFNPAALLNAVKRLLTREPRIRSWSPHTY